MEKTEENLEFTIKNKPINFKFSIAFTVVSVALAFMFVLVIVAFHIYRKLEFIWFIEVIPAISFGVSALGLYAYYKEEFSLRGGEFRYVKLFEKDITVRVESVFCVYMRQIGYKTKIEFEDKKGEISATIIDDGTVLQDGIFIDALEKLNIPVRRN